jgi:hypothetical protein
MSLWLRLLIFTNTNTNEHIPLPLLASVSLNPGTWVLLLSVASKLYFRNIAFSSLLDIFKIQDSLFYGLRSDGPSLSLLKNDWFAIAIYNTDIGIGNWNRKSSKKVCSCKYFAFTYIIPSYSWLFVLDNVDVNVNVCISDIQDSCTYTYLHPTPYFIYLPSLSLPGPIENNLVILSPMYF